MRRLVVALAAVTLTLAGCSTDGEGDNSSEATDSSQSTDVTEPAGDIPEVVAGTPGVDLPVEEGGFGEIPVVDYAGIEPSDELLMAVIVEGDGDEVSESDVVVANYEVSVWGNETPGQSSFENPAPAVFSLDQLIPGWRYGLLGVPEGSRVLLSIPPQWAYPAGNEALGANAEDVLLFVVDVIETQAADDIVGEPSDVTGELPDGVTLEGDPGAPAVPVIAAGTAEPGEIGFTVVAEGTGDPIANGDRLIIGYAATTWDGAAHESSWMSVTWDGEVDPYGAQAPFVVIVGSGTAFDDLVGTPVGSRALFTFPADDALGQPSQAIVADVFEAF